MTGHTTKFMLLAVALLFGDEVQGARSNDKEAARDEQPGYELDAEEKYFPNSQTLIADKLKKAARGVTKASVEAAQMTEKVSNSLNTYHQDIRDMAQVMHTVTATAHLLRTNYLKELTENEKDRLKPLDIANVGGFVPRNVEEEPWQGTSDAVHQELNFQTPETTTGSPEEMEHETHLFKHDLDEAAERPGSGSSSRRRAQEHETDLFKHDLDEEDESTTSPGTTTAAADSQLTQEVDDDFEEGHSFA